MCNTAKYYLRKKQEIAQSAITSSRKHPYGHKIVAPAAAQAALPYTVLLCVRSPVPIPRGGGGGGVRLINVIIQ